MLWHPLSYHPSSRLSWCFVCVCIYPVPMILYMNVQHVCVLFHTCSQQRCDSPRGRGRELKHQPERLMVSHSFEHTIDPGNGAAVLSAPPPRNPLLSLMYSHTVCSGFNWSFFCRAPATMFLVRLTFKKKSMILSMI